MQNKVSVQNSSELAEFVHRNMSNNGTELGKLFVT